MRFPKDHEHSCYIYRGRDDLRRAVLAYVRTSLAGNYATVFIHQFADDATAAQFLIDGGLEAKYVLDRQLVLISGRNSAFEAGGSLINHGHVAALVKEILEESQRRGRAGLRIFADAAQAYIAEGRDNEWFAFESWLGQRLVQRIGLVCAYPYELLRRQSVRSPTERTHLGGVIEPDSETAA